MNIASPRGAAWRVAAAGAICLVRAALGCELAVPLDAYTKGAAEAGAADATGAAPDSAGTSDSSDDAESGPAVGAEGSSLDVSNTDGGQGAGDATGGDAAANPDGDATAALDADEHESSAPADGDDLDGSDVIDVCVGVTDPCRNVATTNNGYYCGTSTQTGFMGGSPYALYNCEHGQTSWTMICDSPCVVAPAGQDDYCPHLPSQRCNGLVAGATCCAEPTADGGAPGDGADEGADGSADGT